tara:strand:+ start:427 stop:582 length:156 start_codon:yes stop_codon:yes gene_type:complete
MKDINVHKSFRTKKDKRERESERDIEKGRKEEERDTPSNARCGGNIQTNMP